GSLFLAALVENLLLVAGKQGEAVAPLAVRCPGALVPHRAGRAVLSGEVHPRDGRTAALALIGPAGTDLALWADGLLGVPVDGERALCEVLALVVLVAGVQSNRSQQFDAVRVAGGDDVRGGDVSGIDVVLV